MNQIVKDVKFGNDARSALQKGAKTVVDSVKVTLGPRGKNVALDKSFSGPTITNDGVSIAREISLKDKFENMGAEIIKEVANKTNDSAGDGTTTAIVLAGAILENGFMKTALGANSTLMRKGIEDAAADAVAELKKMSREVKDDSEIENIATISAESKTLGKTIADIIKKVGPDGVVTVEESQSFSIESEITDGFKLESGYISPYMVTNPEKMTAEIKDAPILIIDKTLNSIQEVLPLLEKIASTGIKELVIIAEDVIGEALGTLVVNKLRGTFNVLAVKAPGYGENKKEKMSDIAVTVGATVVSDDTGLKLEEVDIDVLGRADKVLSSKDSTIIVGGKGQKDVIESHKNSLKNMLVDAKKFDKTRLEERIASLSNGVGVIKVGAATETEMKYLKDKVEDAVNATKAAVEEGIVIGGGAALVKISKKLSEKISNEKDVTNEYFVGYMTLVNALSAPIKQLVKNSGREDAEVILKEIESNEDVGYDAKNDIFPVNMIDAGIIDPVKVTRSGVENAASSVAVLLTTEVAIATVEEESQE